MSDPPPGQQTPFLLASSDGASRSSGLPSSHVGNPIHVITGNKYQEETDLAALPDGLVFARHYNSRAAYNGPLGPGWRHSYDVKLLDQGQTIRLWQADGRRIDFQLSHRDAYGIRHYRSPLASDGGLQVGDYYHWQWPDGGSLLFSRVPGQSPRLHRLTDAQGRRSDFDYNDKGQLSRISDADGRSLRLDYNSAQRLHQMTDPGGQITRYHYDETGNLIQVSYPDGSHRQYHYDDPHDAHNLTGISVQDKASPQPLRIATWAYDDQDRGILSTHAEGVGKVTLNYQDNQTEVTDSQGQVSTYVTQIINGMPLVKAIYGPGCSTCGPGDVTYEYNERLQVIGVINKDGSGKRYRFDEQGRTRQIKRIAADQSETLVADYFYKGDNLQPGVIIEPSVAPDRKHAWFLRYNEAGQMTEVTETGWTPDYQGGWLGMERSTRYDYNDNGKLKAIDGPLPGEFDRVAVNDPQQAPEAETLERDAYGRTVLSQQSNQLTRMQYDVRGRLKQLVRQADTPQSTTTTLGYNLLGQINRITGPKGTAQAEYDAAGQLKALIAPDGRRIEFDQDSEKRLKERRLMDASGKLIHRERRDYNAQGKLTALIRAVDDGQGRLLETSQSLSPATSAGEKLLPLKYDAHGNAIAIPDGNGNTVTRQYDDFGNLLWEQLPDAGLTLYRYDAAGRPRARINEAGVIQTIRYDKTPPETDQTNPPSNASSPDHLVQQDFDEQGRFQRRTGPQQTTTVTYHDDGRLKTRSVTITALNQTYTTRYHYNDKGGLTGKTLPDGTRLNLHYTETGQLAGIEKDHWLWDDEILSIEYDAQGRPKQLTQLDHQHSTYGYDGLGRLNRQTTAQGIQKTYHYTAQGQIQHITDPDNPQHNETYHYDTQGRLKTAQTPTGRYAWHYDGNGNRLRQVHNDLTTTYRYQQGSNQLLAVLPQVQIASAAQPTDLPQQLATPQAPLRFITNAQGRISAVYQGNERIASYTYNADGERIRKTTYHPQPETTYYLYDNQRLSAEINERGEIAAQYLYYQHKPIAKLQGDETYAIHSDHRGAATTLTNDDGQVLWQAQYEPFGQARPQSSNNTTRLNLRLPGQYYDAETGLHYNYQRYYNPQTGRYLTTDPLGIYDGMNTFVYVGNDPINKVDVLGLFQSDMHYYMTYYLARVAGLDGETSLIMAQAAQFVDDNDQTRPIDPFLNPNERALPLYHFIMDYEDGDLGDNPRPSDMDKETYRRTRFLDPSSIQLLQHLRRAALGLRLIEGACSSLATPHNIKAQLYGEYLHALEDSFSHRNESNIPYGSGFNTRGGNGHAADFHSPDFTYNHVSTTVGVGCGPFAIGPFGCGVQPERVHWKYNELRTLAAEKEVFYQIRKDFKSEIVASGYEDDLPAYINSYDKHTDVLWFEMAGQDGVDIGERGEEGYERGNQLSGHLQQFNRHRGYDDENSAARSGKIEILNNALRQRFGGRQDEIPVYDREETTEQEEKRFEILSQFTDQDLVDEGFFYRKQRGRAIYVREPSLLFPCGEFRKKSGCVN